MVPVVAIALGVEVLAGESFVVVVTLLPLAAVALKVKLAYLLLL